ncbi:beta-lactamase family protein [Candidatus Acetothermia bacterium]|nr:beta-lactamase family protein [Candidatus Acetothermia bacterium]MCI2427089.1 beta-lactamase family protein [Candidatus Acetothermia bacterium]MCI2428269.1 beta-lactamase family protein [Candidatus Acetothermia bacterium]
MQATPQTKPATDRDNGTTITNRVDQLFAVWDKPTSPGCALGIIKQGRMIYQRGYGMANLEYDIPISSKTVFRIASTSKQFTAMCVILLSEEGKISLDDNIRKYLPEMPQYESPITIRHLLHHTSGIRDYLELMSLAGMREHDYYTDDEALTLLTLQKELNFNPGDQYLYSNAGYFLLSVIVRRASGKSLREFAAEKIFRPLGMSSTHFHDDHTMIVKNRATGYSPTNDSSYRINMTTLDMVGDGGIFTTVEELFLWDQNFYQPKLGKNSLTQLLTPGRLNNSERLDYACGLIIRDYKGLKMVSHGGAFVGFRAEMIRFPEQEFTVICLANLSSINPHQLALQVADLYLFDQLTEAEDSRTKNKIKELPLSKLESKVGLYHSPTTDTILELSVREEKLTAEIAGFKFQLVPVSAAVFHAVETPINIEFTEEQRVHLRIEGRKPDTLQAIKVVSLSADQLTAYVGDYYSDELQTTYKIVLEKSQLYIKHKNSPPDPFKPALSDMFITGRLTLHFSRSEVGKITSFTVSTGRVKNIRFVRR